MRILTYHKISNPHIFAKHVEHLIHSKYKILSIGEFMARHRSGGGFGSDEAMITFDDGDYSVSEHAMPILRRHKIPATLFVITSLIGTRKPFWWDEITQLTNSYEQVRMAKEVSNAERINFIERLREGKPETNYRQLTLRELITLQKNGVSIANHSHTHPMFDKLTSDEIAEELDLSSTFLKQHGFPFYNVFAYPNGNYTNYSEEVLKSRGIEVAFLFDHKVVRRVDNALRISRLRIDDFTPIWKFRLILSGLHSKLLPITVGFHKLLS